MHVFDLGLKLAAMTVGYLPAKDDGNLVRLSDGPVGIKQALTKRIQCCPPMEDQIVAVLNLREEQPVLTAGLFAFAVR